MSAQIALPRATWRPLNRARWLAGYRPSPAAVCFLLCLTGYLLGAWWVSSRGLTYALDGGDAVSRVEGAYRVFFSRDPHLGAISFVWGPLLEGLLLPLVALKSIWPAMVTQSLSVGILSAVFTAAACWQFFRLLRDVGLGPRLTVLLTAALALDPLVILHGVDGMTEGWFLFFLISIALELNRWLRTGAPTALAACGIYLGISYLARYETTAAACAVVATVVLATIARSRDPMRERLRLAALRTSVVATPFVLAFLGWAAVCWIITGVPLQQFSAVYGNSSLNAAWGITASTNLSEVATNLEQVLRSIMGLEPFLPLIAIAFVVLVVRRRNWTAFGAPVVFGAVLTFMTYAIATHELIPLLRYLVTAIPLALLLLGIVLAPSPTRGGDTSARGLMPQQTPQHPFQVPSPTRLGSVPLLLRGAGVTLIAAGLLGTLVLGLLTVEDPVAEAANPSVAPAVQALVTGARMPPSAYPLTVDQQVAAYLDAQRLPAGSVLMDDFSGYGIEMLSNNPLQFVITSDRDFQQVLADPAAFDVKYVLLPPPTNLGKLDAINRAYPGAYASGKGIGVLVRTFKATYASGTDWRLYRVTATG
jgi:hypothetical protein